MTKYKHLLNSCVTWIDHMAKCVDLTILLKCHI